MSAKKKNKPASSNPPAPSPGPAPAAAAPALAPDSEASVAWIDSTDPRKRLVGKIALVGVWLYAGALLLLALDQTFHWGIWGPQGFFLWSHNGGGGP